MTPLLKHELDTLLLSIIFRTQWCKKNPFFKLHEYHNQLRVINQRNQDKLTNGKNLDFAMKIQICFFKKRTDCIQLIGYPMMITQY